jgi:cytochrome c551/c552
MKHWKLQAAWVAALGLTVLGSAHASAPLVTQYGCLNCHGVHPRGEAPSIERLVEKLGKYKGDDAALAKKVAKYRTGEPLQHIDAHERLSAATATALLQWLAEGGK